LQLLDLPQSAGTLWTFVPAEKLALAAARRKLTD